ncbi:hypothetical protein [Streptomyces sp. NBC_01439]|uniref:hypothetical protein n=1 Tax=Streptomyces sp. NBC_01439 TaxID=2903867 RepID=UPI002E2E887E|nr:hypothetical protein [Streptomyces sp. NBC_01439]
MTHDAKKGLRVTGPSLEVSAAGGSTAATVSQDGPHITPDEFVALWAEARTAYYADEFPPYASRAWRALRPDDPRRLAAALDAAEKWRKYGDEEALLQWFRDASSRGYVSGGRTAVELAELRRPKPPHQLKATPGWPPIQVPGAPGTYLTYIDERREAA